MYVHIPVATATAETTGSILRDVRCEQCGCDYQYRMLRQGSGAAQSLGYEPTSGSEQAAVERASVHLKRLLAVGHDPVPCPSCGWYQMAMVREYRRRRFKWVTPFAWLVLFFGALLAARPVLTHQYTSTDRDERSQARTMVALAGGIAGGIALVAFAAQWRARQRADLNARFPAKPNPLPGAPVGFRRGQMDAPTTSVATPVARERHVPTADADGWVRVQIVDVRWPSVCCTCQVPTEQLEGMGAYGMTHFSVRLCEGCRHELRVRQAVFVAVGTLIAAAVGATLAAAFQVNRERPMEGILTVGFLAGFLGIFGFAIASRWLRPVRFRGYDGETNVVRMRFRNAAYLPLFVDENA